MTTMCARASFARARPVTGRATTTKTSTTQASTMRGESHPLVRSRARVGPRAPCARALAIARGGGLSSTSTRARAVVARAEGGERDGGGRGKGFVGGILLGGAVFGALGFLFAPQLSKTLLGGKRAVNKMLDEESEDELEVTRQVRALTIWTDSTASF